MDKKGDHEILYFVFTLVLVAILALAFLSFQGRLKNTSILDGLFLSRDIALISSAVLTAPGNVFYEYPVTRLGRYSVLISAGSIAIYSDVQQDEQWVRKKIEASYPYASDGHLARYDGHADRLIFFKNGIRSGTTNSEERELLMYPNVRTTDENWVVKKIFTETNQHNSFVLSGVNRQDPDYEIYIKIIIDENVKDVKAWIPVNTASKSRKLASILINDLIANYGVSQAAIYISDDKNLVAAKEAGVILTVSQVFQIQESLKRYHE